MSNSEKNRVPELLKGSIDLRALTVQTFQNAIEMLRNGEIEQISIGKETELIIYTSFATVSGQLLLKEYEDSQLNNTAQLHEILMRLRNNQLEKFSEEGAKKLVNDSGFIPLTNVKIVPYSNPSITHNLGYFLLYPDQIVGITFGEYHQN